MLLEDSQFDGGLGVGHPDPHTQAGSFVTVIIRDFHELLVVDECILSTINFRKGYRFAGQGAAVAMGQAIFEVILVNEGGWTLRGVATQFFLFSPRSLGKWSNFDYIILFKWVVQPPTRISSAEIDFGKHSIWWMDTLNQTFLTFIYIIIFLCECIVYLEVSLYIYKYPKT